jgi:hypothetical protein
MAPRFFNEDDMKIVKAGVLTGQGPDHIFLTTDMPGSFAMYPEPLLLQFEAEKGTGVEYVKKHFNLDATVIYRGAGLKSAAPDR